jgi:hypothetical protein
VAKALTLAGVAALLALGGLAVAQPPQSATPNDLPPVTAEPSPVIAIDPNAVKDIPKPDAEPVKPQVVTTPTLPPDKRPRYPIAIVQALDKITAETLRFEAPVGQPVRYKNLIFTVRSCEATAADEQERDAIAHMEVAFQPTVPAGQPTVAAKTIFRGWMFAASPSISPLEHPTYDAWLIACKANDPGPTPAPSPRPAVPSKPVLLAPPPVSGESPASAESNLLNVP